MNQAVSNAAILTRDRKLETVFIGAFL